MNERIQTLQRLLEADPEDTDLRLELAGALQGEGERRRAVVEYGRAAAVLYRRGALQDAAAVCKLILDLMEDHAPTHELLIAICHQSDALASQTARIIAGLHGIKIPVVKPPPRQLLAPIEEEEVILLAAPKSPSSSAFDAVGMARSAAPGEGAPASGRRWRPRGDVPSAPASTGGISIHLPASQGRVSSEAELRGLERGPAGRPSSTEVPLLDARGLLDPVVDEPRSQSISTIDRLKALARARQEEALDELPVVSSLAAAEEVLELDPDEIEIEPDELELEPDDVEIEEVPERSTLEVARGGLDFSDLEDEFTRPVRLSGVEVPVPIPPRQPRRTEPAHQERAPQAPAPQAPRRGGARGGRLPEPEPEQTSLVDMGALVRQAEARRLVKPLASAESTSVVDVQRLESLARGMTESAPPNEPIPAGQPRRGHHLAAFDASTRVAPLGQPEVSGVGPGFRDVHRASTVVAQAPVPSSSGRSALPEVEDATREVPEAAQGERWALGSTPSSGPGSRAPQRQGRRSPKVERAADTRLASAPSRRELSRADDKTRLEPSPPPARPVVPESAASAVPPREFESYRVSADQLANIPLLSGLPLAVTNGLIEVAFVQKHPAGTVLLDPAMEVIGVAIVLEGEVLLSDVRGQRAPVLLRGGDFFAQEQYLTGQAPSWRAETQRETVTLFLVPELLAQLGERDPSIWDALWRQAMRA